MRQTNIEQWGRRAGKALVLGISLGALSACDDLLEVEIPHLLTEDAISGPGSAELQVTSAIALFECGISGFGWVALGHEDVMESVAGVANTAHVWRDDPATGTCDTSSQAQAWFDQVMGARALIVGTDLVARTPNGIYTRLVNDWDATLVPDRERLMAIGALYMAASLSHFGEFYCEGAIDLGPKLVPSDFLTMADAWVDSALIHFANLSGGDVALPNAAAPSGVDAATALRARIRWANGNLAGAATAAQAVLTSDPDFVWEVTRGAGEQRRNKIFHAGTAAGFSAGLGQITWWNNAAGSNRGAVTGLTPTWTGVAANRWPNPIPFTGYIFLGVLPDGETLLNVSYGAGTATDPTRTVLTPVRWANETRDANQNPVDITAGAMAAAVPDTRVTTIYKSIQGPTPAEVPAKYGSDSDPIPFATWREMTLILAQWENSTNNDQAAAIAHINTLRNASSLPAISGAYLTSLTDGTNDQFEVRTVILEEARREYFAEAGRYWSVKIQNADMLWFPRKQGVTPYQGYAIQGGVRLQFPDDEYTNNSALGGPGGRGTSCGTLQANVP